MVTILVMGMTGEGKSEWIKDYIRDRNCFVMDIQNEYGKRTKYPNQTPINLSDNVNDNRSRYIGGDKKEFMKLVERKRNTICVFEEATAFFSGRTEDSMSKLLINKMHTGNVYILVFHSIVDAPPKIVRLANYAVIYRTNDEQYQVEKKYPSLLPAFLQMRNIGEKARGKYQVVKII